MTSYAGQIDNNISLELAADFSGTNIITRHTHGIDSEIIRGCLKIIALASNFLTDAEKNYIQEISGTNN